MLEKMEEHLVSPENINRILKVFESIRLDTDIKDVIKDLEQIGWDNVCDALKHYHNDQVVFISLINNFVKNSIYELMLFFISSISREVILKIPLYRVNKREDAVYVTQFVGVNIEAIANVIDLITHPDNIRLIAWIYKKYDNYYSDLLKQVVNANEMGIFIKMLTNVKEVGLLEDILYSRELLIAIVEAEPFYLTYLLKFHPNYDFIKSLYKKNLRVLHKLLNNLMQYGELELYNNIFTQLDLDYELITQLGKAIQRDDALAVMEVLNFESLKPGLINNAIKLAEIFIKPLINITLFAKDYDLFAKVLESLSILDWTELLKNNNHQNNEPPYKEIFLQSENFKLFARALFVNQFYLKIIKEFDFFFYLSIINKLGDEGYSLFQMEIHRFDAKDLLPWLAWQPFKKNLYNKVDLVVDLEKKGFAMMDLIAYQDQTFYLHILNYYLKEKQIDFFHRVIKDLSSGILLALFATEDAEELKTRLLESDTIYLKHLIDSNLDFIRIKPSKKYLDAGTSEITLFTTFCRYSKNYLDLLKHINEKFFDNLTVLEKTLLRNILKPHVKEDVTLVLKKETKNSNYFSFYPNPEPFEPKKIKLDTNANKEDMFIDLSDLSLLEADLSPEEKEARKHPGIASDKGIDIKSLDIFLYRTLRTPLLVNANVVLMPSLELSDKIQTKDIVKFHFGGKIRYLTNIARLDGEHCPIYEDELIPANPKCVIWPIHINDKCYKLLFININRNSAFIIDPLKKENFREQAFKQKLHFIILNFSFGVVDIPSYFLEKDKYSSEYLIALLVLIAQKKLRLDFDDFSTVPGILTQEIIEKIHLYQDGILGPEYVNCAYDTDPLYGNVKEEEVPYPHYMQ